MRFSFLPGAGLAALLLAAGCQSSPQTTESATTTGPAAAQSTGPATPAGLYVRKNANSPEAKADLDALARALAIMKKLPCDDPRSWYYQGAIHNVPDSIAHNPYCPRFTTGGAPMAGWDGCTHGPNQAGENHFLIWHRLFTLHFERIVRKLSGKADFALPYWDYTNTQAGYRVMPAAFRSRTDSLYESARYQPLNAGQPINASMNAALDTALIYQYHSFSLFNSNIDQAPHGAMHDYIGGGNLPTPSWNRIYQKPVPGGLMGNVPSAAFDPIFWVHHANIDYLWTTWARSGRGRNPDLAALQHKPWKYLFFDENGKAVSYRVDSAYATALHPDYRYDVYAAPASGNLLASGAPAQETAPVTLATTTVGKAVVGSTKFSTRLAVPAPRTTLLKSATPRPPAAGGQRLLLQVEVSLAREPKGFYEVYVRNQGGAGLLAVRPQLAGILSFFGVAHRHGAGHADMPGMTMPADKFRKTFTFDITDEVNAASFTGGLDVQVVPQGAGAVPITIEKLTLLTQAR
jgi:hypothetical protein